jgi:ubiquinone/menaquinone biosynthesis C-methylase UbiE
MADAAYDAIAGWYEQYLEGPLYREIVLPALLELIGDVRERVVLDLACGQGLIARALAARGARMTGVDISLKLLEIARGYEQRAPLGIEYIQDDAQVLTALGDAQFDGTVCNLASMDIPDLAATYRAVQRVLKAHGWFVCSITHPCFEVPQGRWVTDEDGVVARAVSGYFAEGFWRSNDPNGVRGKIGAYHRTLSTYLNALADAGFALERLVEPEATGHRAEQVPGNREVPSILVMRTRAI